MTNQTQFENTKEIDKINLDHIYNHKQIKKRCKFCINNITRINQYPVKMSETYWKNTFYYHTKDKVVNFYGKRANDIMERAIATTLHNIESKQAA